MIIIKHILPTKPQANFNAPGKAALLYSQAHVPSNSQAVCLLAVKLLNLDNNEGEF